MRKLGVHKLGRQTTGTADPNRGKEYCIHMASCSEYRAGGRIRKEGMFRAMVFVFLRYHSI